MIDRSKIGATLGPRKALVERDILRLFTAAIGETNPLFTDDAWARAQGYPAVMAPPTYVFALKVGVLHPLEYMSLIGMTVDLGKTFHAEQSFVYHAPIFAGDELTFIERIDDIYEKKNGALTFFVTETEVRNQVSAHIADIRFATVVTQ